MMKLVAELRKKFYDILTIFIGVPAKPSMKIEEVIICDLTRAFCIPCTLEEEFNILFSDEEIENWIIIEDMENTVALHIQSDAGAMETA